MTIQFFGVMGPAPPEFPRNVTIVDVWDCSGDYLTDALQQIREAAARGWLVILSLHRCCFQTEWDHGEPDPALTWTMRLDVGRLDRLDDALTAEGLWPAVFALTLVDEPFNRAYLSPSGPDRLRRMARDLRLLHEYFARRWPRLKRWLNFSLLELMPERPECLPRPCADAFGADVVGWDDYTDSPELGGTDNGSFAGFIDRAAQWFPGKPLVLVVDGLIYTGETVADKLYRINRAYTIARADPRVFGLLIYTIAADPARERRVFDVPVLHARYTQIAREITGRTT